jgi:hypothetical protein
VLDWSSLWDGAGRSHRYGSSVPVEVSAARPMSVVDLWAARMRGVLSPQPCEGSNAVPKSWAAGGGWGTLLSGASGCPASRLKGFYWSAVCACAGLSRNNTFLYVGERLELADILTKLWLQ